MGIMKKIFGIFIALLPMFALAADFPALDQRFSNCENRWFFMQSNDANNRVLAFAYIDPTAGPTYEFNGEMALKTNGGYSKVPNELKNARLIFRVDADFRVACLDDNVVRVLGLEAVPEWLDSYKDERSLGTHNVEWASFYNHIGASKNAIDYLQQAQSLGVETRKYYFEFGYALNALEKFDEAESLLEKAVQRYPNDTEITAELAYVYLSLRQFERAIVNYRLALKKDKNKESQRRPQFAMGIAVAYSMLGDQEESNHWKETAAKWTPKK